MRAMAGVRNPVLLLPSARRLAELDPEARSVLRAVLFDMYVDATARAEKAWRLSKGPMALYWKAVAVYARHLAHAVPR